MLQKSQPVIQVNDIRDLSIKGPDLAPGHLRAEEHRTGFSDQVGAGADATLHDRPGFDLAFGPWRRSVEDAGSVRADDGSATEGQNRFGMAFQRRHLPGETIRGQEVILMKELGVAAFRRGQGPVPVSLRPQVALVPMENQSRIVKGVHKGPTGVRRGVVEDQQFEIAMGLVQDGLYGLCKIALAIENWQADRNQGPLG